MPTPPQPDAMPGNPAPPLGAPPPPCDQPAHDLLFDGIERLLPAIHACRDGEQQGDGQVGMQLRIDPDLGRVRSAVAVGPQDAVDCVSPLLISRARFDTQCGEPPTEVTYKVQLAPLSSDEPDADADADAGVDQDSDAGLDRGEGRLVVATRPRTHVYVDGVLFGRSPQDDIRLDPGEHIVVLIDGDSGLIQSFVADVSAGTETAIVRSLTTRL